MGQCACLGRKPKRGLSSNACAKKKPRSGTWNQTGGLRLMGSEQHRATRAIRLERPIRQSNDRLRLVVKAASVWRLQQARRRLRGGPVLAHSPCFHLIALEGRSDPSRCCHVGIRTLLRLGLPKIAWNGQNRPHVECVGN